MIAMEAHVYAYYLNLAKGRMSAAARLAGVKQKTFVRKTFRFGLDWRKFRGEVCACLESIGRCKVCSAKNRESARLRYHARKGNPVPVPRESMERTQKMLFLSARISALQRIMQLSK